MRGAVARAVARVVVVTAAVRVAVARVEAKVTPHQKTWKIPKETARQVAVAATVGAVVEATVGLASAGRQTRSHRARPHPLLV